MKLAAVRPMLVVPAFVLAAIAVLIASLKAPGSNTASRIMKYEDRDAVISNEAEQVIRMFDFEQYGTKYTAIVLKPVSALASGPAVLVADATGRIIARCSDCGDDTGFCERWALMALTREDFRSEDVEAERTHDFSEDVWPGRGSKAYEQELLDWAH